MSIESFSSLLVHSMEKRCMLLKLLIMNHIAMEDNSCLECPYNNIRALLRDAV